MKQLIQRAYQNAIDKGWHDKPTTFTELLALCHSEISEAWAEDIDKGTYYNADKPDKPEGFAVELTDLKIRIFDMAGKFNIDLVDVTGTFGNISMLDTAALLNILHADLSDVLEDYRNGIKPGGKNTITAKLSCIISLVDSIIVQKAGESVDDVLEVKMRYNELREYRHGGKVI